MIIRSLVKLVTGFPTDAAETTTAFIKSPMGVRQALYVNLCHSLHHKLASYVSEQTYGTRRNERNHRR